MERLEAIEGELHFSETTRRLEERIHELEARNEALRLNETNGGA